MPPGTNRVEFDTLVLRKPPAGRPRHNALVDVLLTGIAHDDWLRHRRELFSGDTG